MIERPRLFLDRQHPRQDSRMWEMVALLKRDDPLSPVTVVGPSVYANLSLRAELASSGFANVRFLVLPRVTELLGAPRLARRGLQPLAPVVEGAAIRASLAESAGRLAAVRDNPATLQSLRSTFRELRGASAAALGSVSRRGGLRAEVVELYRSFRKHTRRFYDRELLARSAAEAVVAGDSTGLDDLGFVIFYQISNLSAAEAGLVEALANVGRCAVVLGLSGDPQADAAVESLAERLTAHLGAPSHTVPVDQKEIGVSKSLSHSTSGSLPRFKPGAGSAPERRGATAGTEIDPHTPHYYLPSPASHLLIAPDPHEEVRAIIRRVLSDAEAGTPFHRMALLYRKTSPYSALIREQLELSGVPVAGPDHSPLSRTGVGRTLVGLMRLAEGEFDRDSVMSWLTGCPVRPPRIGGPDFVPSQWDAISRKAGVVRGLEQWTQRLLRYADAQERRADYGLIQDEISEARAARMRSEARSSRDLLGFIERLAESVSPPADGSTWDEFCNWAAGLLRYFLLRREDMPDSEQKALDVIEEKLQAMAAAQSVDPSPSLATFRLALDEELSESLGHLGTTGQGVFVAPLRTATAMHFDVVYMLGMIEGSVPPAIRDDPLIPDSDRLAAGGEAGGLPIQRDRRSRERYEFLSALNLAPRRVLSYPFAEPAGGRANYPSRWFLEQANALEGARVSAASLGTLGTRHWLTVIPSVERALSTVGDSAAADPHDYDLERVWRWSRTGHRVWRHPIAVSGLLARSLDMSRMRNSHRLTAWDGNLSKAGITSGLKAGLQSSVHSPTSLERWAQCPFSYFLSNVLRVAAVERPEDAYSITPLERGSLVHAILERFIRSVQQVGTIPRPGERWGEDHRAEIRHVAAEEFNRVESEGAVGTSLMWDLVRDEILDDLGAFLDRDSQIRDQFGTSPTMVEAQFGMGAGPSVKLILDLEDGTNARFRGIIDRIDVSEDGRRALVLDYKTGSDSPYRDLEKDSLDRGRRLQLPVYSLAARQALGADVEVSAAYWFVTGRGSFGFRPRSPVDFGSGAMPERFSDVVRSIAAGIGSGVFPANPGDPDPRGGWKNCMYCDFDSLCPSRRDVLWQRKRDDPTVVDYVRLSEE